MSSAFLVFDGPVSFEYSIGLQFSYEISKNPLRNDQCFWSKFKRILFQKAVQYWRCLLPLLVFSILQQIRSSEKCLHGLQFLPIFLLRVPRTSQSSLLLLHLVRSHLRFPSLGSRLFGPARLHVSETSLSFCAWRENIKRSSMSSRSIWIFWEGIYWFSAQRSKSVSPCEHVFLVPFASAVSHQKRFGKYKKSILPKYGRIKGASRKFHKIVGIYWIFQFSLLARSFVISQNQNQSLYQTTRVALKTGLCLIFLLTNNCLDMWKI